MGPYECMIYQPKDEKEITQKGLFERINQNEEHLVNICESNILENYS